MHQDLLEAQFYSVAWSASHRKLFMIRGRTDGGVGRGGFFDQLTHLHMFSYNDTDGWYNLTRVARGEIPEPRQSACLVSAFRGSKMVLFGGYIRDKVRALHDIHILDVDTMLWTRGPDAPVKEQRAKAACAVSNDHLIAWGGELRMEDCYRPQNSTIVFNLKTNKWTSTYSATPDPATSRNATTTTSTLTPSTSASPTEAPLTSRLSLDAIVAVAALGIAGVTLAGGAFVLCRIRRRHSQKIQQNHQDPFPSTKADYGILFKNPLEDNHPGRETQEPPVNEKSRNLESTFLETHSDVRPNSRRKTFIL